MTEPVALQYVSYIMHVKAKYCEVTRLRYSDERKVNLVRGPRRVPVYLGVRLKSRSDGRGVPVRLTTARPRITV